MLKSVLKVATVLSIIFILNSCSDNSKQENKSLSLEISKLKKEQSVLEKNKEVVTKFYQEFFGDLNFDSANKYIGDVYIQHNPALADGKEALIAAAKIWFNGAPNKTIRFNLVVAEADLVFVQIIEESNGNKFSTMDVFRVTDEKISEHWDAFATFKKNAESQNDNPLF